MDRTHCDICHRAFGTKLPFLCVVDARNRLYEGRLQNATCLIRNDELEQQIKALISSPNDSERTASSNVVRVANWKSEQAAVVDRTSLIIAQADKLKLEVDAARKEFHDKQDRISRRKSDLAAVSEGIAARRTRQVEDVERSIQVLKYKWSRSADAMAATRAFLCEEAARLYGLRQIRKGNQKRFEIGGVEVVDLHALNNLSPEVISTSLAHIAHILMLASHYLSIRLPAEVTLPHRDYPRPTILSVPSSYRHGDILFPGLAMPQTTSDTRSEGDNQRNPRPRPLFVDKPLPILLKEDPASYSLFIEGVSLLAYDIAWACNTQGISIGDKNSYDDVYNIGQNLWRLLIGDQLHRKAVEPAFPNPADSPRDDEVQRPKPQIGRWSHGTTYSFLGGAEGTEFIRNFKLPSPIKLTDRLKKKLSSEAPMLEWEKIDGDEARAGDEEGGEGGARMAGLSGWTKVKNRG
ncbi:UV radiation resistance protein and autophagy-related subunit 14-domain-containing protein [Coniochaeta sp. 2T2.1]|nr:UV radiation resistance protein and autophagy-related subunit 14-domain-containing protein [Coniochaeta sp. 2T2.1]